MAPIREAHLHVQLVEDGVEILGVLGFLGSMGPIREPFGVFRLEIVVGIAEKRFGRGDELVVVGARAEEVGFVCARGLWASTSLVVAENPDGR